MPINRVHDAWHYAPKAQQHKGAGPVIRIALKNPCGGVLALFPTSVASFVDSRVVGCTSISSFRNENSPTMLTEKLTTRADRWGVSPSPT